MLYYNKVNDAWIVFLQLACYNKLREVIVVMDLQKTGNLIKKLRLEQKLTQQEVAKQLGICAKTVSKWETGRGFPDVSLLSSLSLIFGVDVKKLLAGELPQAKTEAKNVKKTKFYVCEQCGNLITDMGNAEILCCGRKLSPLVAKTPDSAHELQFSMVEDEHYITFPHPMTKEHYISFLSYVRFDRVLTVKLYPEQAGELRFPVMRGGSYYYYCSEHGLFQIKK